MDYEHWKSKPLGTIAGKYGTRKSWSNWTYLIFPRQGWWYWQTPHKRSKRRWRYKKMTNKQIRLGKNVWQWGSYKRAFDLARSLD